MIGVADSTTLGNVFPLGGNNFCRSQQHYAKSDLPDIVINIEIDVLFNQSSVNLNR